MTGSDGPAVAIATTSTTGARPCSTGSRTTSGGAAQQTPGSSGHDAGWDERTVLRLAPHPDLDASHRAAIEAQYEMTNGVAEITVRNCQVVYFLKRYQLEEPISLKAPHQAPLILLNRDEAIAAIPPGMCVPLLGQADRAAQLIVNARAAYPIMNEQELMEKGMEALLAP